MLRNKIVHEGSDQLTYEIREIVRVAHEFQALGISITWENIGDPIEKGDKLAPWIKEIIQDLIGEDKTYGYVATEGVVETRSFLADLTNGRKGAQITKEDILFFNGLGDAVAKVFGYLKREARVIGPSPAYSTHSSAEAAHSGYSHLTYKLDPGNRWMPDLVDLENKVKYNDSIAGILIINPDNPTGAVYPREVIAEMVAIARRHKVFIICDEIYTNIIYGGADQVRLCDVIGDVPGISMRGISKEFPWPGSRCGWIEVYNQNNSATFSKYIQSILNSKMLEVCSTSLPQYSIPLVMGDPRYVAHLALRRDMFAARSLEAYNVFKDVKGVTVTQPQGAFYFTVIFISGVLNNEQTLEIKDNKVKSFVVEKVKGVAADKRFVYYLLAAYGICVVPLTGFCCEREGFRVTLLETDDAKRKNTWLTLCQAIGEYIS
jgi:aspartate/methionine/tyrosine aminotransferase